jgi:hypothetical protein
MMRTFLPSTLPQLESPSAIQLLGLSNADLSEEGDIDIVSAPPSTQPHTRHQIRQHHHARGEAEHPEILNPSTVRPTADGITANATVHTNPSIADTPITTVTQSHSLMQPHPQPHPQRNDETKAIERQPQQIPQHVPSESHRTLQHARGIVRPSTTQSQPQPPQSAAQAELHASRSVPADNPGTAREQMLRERTVRCEATTSIAPHRPARAASEDGDVTHETAIIFVSYRTSKSTNKQSSVTS